MKSYQRFLQMDLLPSEREDGGLQSVFTSVFRSGFPEMSQLEFVDYAIGNWECKCSNLKGLHHLAQPVAIAAQASSPILIRRATSSATSAARSIKNTPTFCNKCGDPVAMQLKYDVNECQERGMTYSARSKSHSSHDLRQGSDSGAKTIRDIKEQEVFYGDIPLMTENGTFIINVRARHRQPVAPLAGVFFDPPTTAATSWGRLFLPRLLGEFEYDSKNILYVRIDRKRKFSAPSFARAGMKSNEDILRTFYQVERISLRDKDLFWNVSPGLVDRKLTHEIKNPKSEEVIVGAHKRINENLLKELIKAKIRKSARHSSILKAPTRSRRRQSPNR